MNRRIASTFTAVAVLAGANACSVSPNVEAERSDYISTPNFDTTVSAGDDYSGMSVADCSRNPDSWATDSGGIYSNQELVAVDSVMLLGIVETYDAKGQPVINDGLIVSRSLGKVSITPLIGKPLDFSTEDILASTEFPTKNGNTILVEPYRNYDQGSPLESNRIDEPLVVTIKCGD